MVEIPEVDFRTVRVKRNTYARRIATGGVVVQAGRERPKRLLGPRRNPPRSVRLPDATWALLEHRARAKGLTLHAALRQAILEGAGGAPREVFGEVKTYHVILELDESGHWIAALPAIRGCHTYGRSLSEARSRIREALSLFVPDAATAKLVDNIRSAGAGATRVARRRR